MPGCENALYSVTTGSKSIVSALSSLSDESVSNKSLETERGAGVGEREGEVGERVRMQERGKWEREYVCKREGSGRE